MKIINPNFLIKMYKKGFFPMAENATSTKVDFYKPKKRFLLPILNFHIPKKLFKDFKKKNIYSH
tara:strand:- start:725 stop:916 length:192 start_codon:yes stop_codon:yes gene_type:complete